MDDFQIRLLSVMQNSSFIAAIARNNKTIIGIDYFAYNAGPTTNPTFSAVAAAGAASTLVPIQADSDFVLTYISAATVQAGAIVSNPVATCQFTDTGTGKTFFSSPTLLTLVTGTNGFPFILPAPRVIAPNVNIKIDVVNNTAAPLDFWFSLEGARVYYG